jgi:hypothetical protein
VIEGDSREEGIGSPSAAAALDAGIALGAGPALDGCPEPPVGAALAAVATGAYNGQRSSRQRSYETPRA